MQHCRSHHSLRHAGSRTNTSHIQKLLTMLAVPRGGVLERFGEGRFSVQTGLLAAPRSSAAAQPDVDDGQEAAVALKHTAHHTRLAPGSSCLACQRGKRKCDGKVRLLRNLRVAGWACTTVPCSLLPTATLRPLRVEGHSVRGRRCRAEAGPSQGELEGAGSAGAQASSWLS